MGLSTFFGQSTMLSRFSDFVSSQPRVALLMLALIAAILAWAMVWLLLRSLLSWRKLTNAERLQLIESGQSAELLKTLERQAGRNRFFGIALALALCVPAVSVLGAAYSTSRAEGSFGTSLVAWIAAILVSLTSVICSVIVMTTTNRASGSDAS